jgi:N-acetylglucosamine-6-phosphate deacetylase
VTHIFNAMPLAHHRDPGVLGAAYTHQQLKVQLIADGIHVHPASLRLAIRQKGISRTCLITDSMNATGLEDGEYRVGGLEVVLRGGEARLKHGGALAGSLLTLNRAVANIIRWAGVPVSDAVAMASLTPAAVLGLDRELGSLAPGKIANLAVFDREFRVVGLIFRGGPADTLPSPA